MPSAVRTCGTDSRVSLSRSSANFAGGPLKGAFPASLKLKSAIIVTEPVLRIAANSGKVRDAHMTVSSDDDWTLVNDLVTINNLRWELISDLFWDLAYYNTFDSDPPSGSTSTNDYGIVTSVGYSF